MLQFIFSYGYPFDYFSELLIFFKIFTIVSLFVKP